ncbi:Glycoside hydrolase family 5 protein [Pleurostoma richardsiae]|uniref:Mannan endo-1,4-beta-mannosidase A n=1 Tax=Pleurostoma richardsiae TaxID=41990 RepID=A0AA38VMK7_9PEZI|nr:Glycoside hydrolase family 5 protein [Pleurostoma richardsiae]
MLSISTSLCLIAAAAAQQTVWGQCGGVGWSGAISCVSGSYCQYLNDYYYQCLPGMTRKRSFHDCIRYNVDYINDPGHFYIKNLIRHNIKDKVDNVFTHFAQSGLKILRIWGFNDVNTIPSNGQVYFQYLTASGSSINTGTTGLQRLDYAVSAASAKGIKLIINFVNNWDDFGGVTAYTTAFGGSHQDWFTNAAAQGQYRAYIKEIVSRYKSSPAVFAWELMNEPRCNGCDTDVIYDWAAATSAYVKSLDPSHMVTLGDEGFGLPGNTTYPYTYAEGLDFVKNLDITTLDFGTFHLYPEYWNQPYDFGNDWIEDHGAACAAVGKPCLLEEYGTTSNHCGNEAPWQATALATEGMAADTFWQLGDQLTWSQSANDGFTIYYGSSEWTCLVTNHVAAIQ